MWPKEATTPTQSQRLFVAKQVQMFRWRRVWWPYTISCCVSLNTRLKLEKKCDITSVSSNDWTRQLWIHFHIHQIVPLNSKTEKTYSKPRHIIKHTNYNYCHLPLNLWKVPNLPFIKTLDSFMSQYTFYVTFFTSSFVWSPAEPTGCVIDMFFQHLWTPWRCRIVTT